MKLYRDPEVVAGFTLERPFPGFPGITHCGEALCSLQYTLPKHIHSGIELMYVIFGEVAWQVEGRLLKQRAGELCVTGAKREHSTASTRHPEFKVIYAGIDLEAMGAAGERLRSRFRGFVANNFGRAPEFEGVLRGILSAAMARKRASDAVPRKFAELLLAMLEERGKHSAKRSVGTRRVFSPPIHEAMNFLRLNLGRPVPVAELARMAHLGESHFAASFREQIGVSPAAYHRGIRLEAAKAALGMPEASVAQIAQEFGFSSSQHFSTLFRQMFGVTPRQWQRQATCF